MLFNTKSVSAQVKPNFIFILADDLGYADVGVYGSTKIKTPNIDQLAQEGMMFTNFYSNSAVCCPTRAAFLTGRYSTRVGIDHVIPLSGNNSADGLEASEVTLPEILKNQGYATSLVGKWHLGHMEEYNPTLHGFDSFFGLAYSNDYNGGLVPLYRDTQIIEQETDQTLLTHRFTQEALDFIDQYQDQPFFLYLAYTAPHVPLFPHPDFAGTSTAGAYGDVVEEMDWGIGQVMNKVNSLGLADNTIIVFASDNGPWIYHGEDAGSAEPFYCGKGTYYEGGIRVPFIVKWPGKVTPGSESNVSGAIFDLFPTLVKMSGASLPADKVIDGQDLQDVLFSNGQRADDDIAFTFLDRNRAIRAGKWKLKTAYSGGAYWMDTCGQESHPDLLFDLSTDPGETTNLASQYPDILDYMNTELSYFSDSLQQPNNQPPIANFSITYISSLTYSFDATTSTDTNGSITNYSWDFGDNTTGSGINITHTFPNNNKRHVRLVVTDNQGLKDGVIIELNVGTTPTLTPTPPPKPGDANSDGFVDGEDYIIWITHFGQSTPNGASDGDFSDNGTVGSEDYTIWLNNYNS